MTEITSYDKKLATEMDSMPRKFAALPSPEGKAVVDGNWRLNLMSDDIVCLRGAESLCKFLHKHCGIDLSIVTKKPIRSLEVRLACGNVSGEGYDIAVRSDVVDVRGDSPAGALYGAHRLQWMMGANGGPYLDLGSFGIEPAAAIRIAATPFRQPFDDGGDPLTYTDGYLDLMAHYGCNALHLYIDLYDYVESLPQAPELQNVAAPDRIARLSELAKRAVEHNIGIYLHANATRRRQDEPVFRTHPELRGAQSWEAGSYCFCSSESLTAEIYADVIKDIVRQAPNVKGVIAIVGGECLLHCYTRPYPRTPSGTNCPRCATRGRSEVVAGLVNAMAGRLWKEYPGVEFIVWPYSAHLWSETSDQRELISLLDKRMSFMTCYEKDAWIEVDGAKTTIFDYSISYVGPSEKYRSQYAMAGEMGLPFCVKTESSVSVEMLNVPYIPTMENWRARWQGLLSGNPRGILANWRFTGLTGTLAEEVAYRETWKCKTDEDSLVSIATRLAGENGRDCCLAAWHSFSEAFSKLAFCPGLSGFPYFRGPMYLGPAHPLLLYNEECSQLPDVFFRIDPCVRELTSDSQVAVATDSTQRQPTFFDDCRWTLPLGLERMHGSLEVVCGGWDVGVNHYGAAVESADPERRGALQSEVDVALMAGVVLKSALNLARFQSERNRIINGSIADEEVEESYRRLKSVIKDDLDNALLGLKLAKEYYRFGYGFTYGRAFDAEMIEAKIDFTHRVLLPDVDRFYDVLVSHAFARPFIVEENDPA